MVSAPEPPDPMKTARAQAGMNRDTATDQQLLNMTNQVGPDGTLTYSQTGTNSYVDSQGKTITLPQFTATTTLSPEQQAIKAQQDKASLNLGTLAAEQSGKLQQYLNEPFTFDNQDAANWAYDLGAQRLDPRFAQQEDQLRTTLANKGIREGSAAWNAEMARLGESKNDAYNNLMLTGRQQAFTEALQNRNQPINEITALMSGGQVSMPQFASTPQTGVGGVDYTGLVNQKYQADLANSQSSMNALGGLFGLGMKMLPFSDRRLKSEIKRVGTLFNGLAVYSYRLMGGPVQIGIMADEALDLIPEAVHTDQNGFRHVDYALATEVA